NNMKVDIWSDIRCPFCYIGKRKFEAALSRFPRKDKVSVIWHSFELDPAMETDTSVDAYTYLAARKGQSRDWSVQMHRQVTRTAKAVGLDYNFDKAVVANSFNAHRLIQLAKTKGLGDAAEEALFRAYFTGGKNIDDKDELVEIGTGIGLPAPEVTSMLASDAYTREVREDEAAADNIGINGVPFFVLNNKYGVSGAQDPETFLSALEQAWSEYEKDNPSLIMREAAGDTCDADGTCTIEKTNIK
ncbi:MAG TPA: DsbA family oxidoreductase, partial [Chitinophagaceae bacterium]